MDQYQGIPTGHSAGYSDRLVYVMFLTKEIVDYSLEYFFVMSNWDSVRPKNSKYECRPQRILCLHVRPQKSIRGTDIRISIIKHYIPPE